MASSIDPLVPPEGEATTAALRANFLSAKLEIETLQAALAALPVSIPYPHVRSAGRYRMFGNFTYDQYGSSSAAANKVFVFPVWFERQVKVSTVGIRVVTYAASVIRIGVYSSVFNGSQDLPDSLLVAADPITVGATGNRSANMPFEFAAGSLYWIALQASAAIPLQMAYADKNSPPLGYAQIALDVVAHLWATLGSPGLPATLPALGVSSGLTPTIWFNEIFA